MTMDQTPTPAQGRLLEESLADRRPELLPPTTAVRVSFLTAMAEFQSEGRGAPDDDSVLGRHLRGYAATWTSPDGFAAYVTWLRAQAWPDTPRPNGFVPSTDLWWIQGETFLGRVSIRHGLTDGLLRTGGHIGYDVRPTARRQGHATAILAAALTVAAGLGIERALLTCDPANVASRRVIERNGGVPEHLDDHTLRFWIAIT